MAGHTGEVVSAEGKSRVKPVPAIRAGEMPRSEKPQAVGVEVRREVPPRSLPNYRVEPPDLLSITVPKLVPRGPYRIDFYDVLQIRAVGTLPDQPIDGFFLVEAGGIVTLGPAYGKVKIVGMTVENAKDAIVRQLKIYMEQPEVSVQLARTAGTPPVTDEYLVCPDGTINLRQYGSLKVAGKTVAEICADLTKYLSRYFESPDVGVEVKQFNSKVFYVITEGAEQGDNIRRVPWYRQRHGARRLGRGQRSFPEYPARRSGSPGRPRTRRRERPAG